VGTSERGNKVSGTANMMGHAVEHLVEALSYKPKGRKFDSR
jgi:hypothetical protein